MAISLLKGIFFALIIQKKNMANLKLAYLFSQEQFRCPYQPQIHSETLVITGAVFAQLEYLYGLPMGIFISQI